MEPGDTILYGHDKAERIVAVETGESEAVLYVRADGGVERRKEPFEPWLLVTSEEDTRFGGVQPVRVVELEGEDYRFLVAFEQWSDYLGARRELKERGASVFAFAFPEKQFLVSSGKTLFKGMPFEDVRRMQVDIETTPYPASSNSGGIVLIAVCDNAGFEKVIEGTEEQMLRELVEIVRERDPDVIEGHNIFGFDLPYISTRAAKAKVSTALGRDGSELTFGSQRNVPIGGYSRPYVPARVYGRHVIDTLIAVQRYDVGRARLESHGLKEVTKALGISEPDRVMIPGADIAEMYRTDPERVKVYNLQDVRETRSLAALVCPAEFYMTQMVPDTYQSASTGGNGEKINSILIREYLRQGRAIPAPREPREIVGGYTELREVGLIRNVVKCDVESLYPSLMLSQQLCPKSESLCIFLPALADLTHRRIEAKNKARQATDPREREYWDGLQGTFKILINSFYGYLGGPFNFNDFDAAEQITTTGQALVKQIAAAIEERGGNVIEIDTDGVYFKPPDGIDDEAAEEKLIEDIGSHLAKGIRLAHDGRWAAIVSLKVKNYILVGYNGAKTFKGASLRSRADERFGREFISQLVDLLIVGDKEGIKKLYDDLAERIRAGALPVEQFSRRERITGKTFSSSQKKRMAAVAEGLKVGEFINVYEKVDGTLGLAEEYAGDENRDKLLDKLYKFALRLSEAFGEEFDDIFTKPTRARGKGGAPSKEQLGLF